VQVTGFAKDHPCLRSGGQDSSDAQAGIPEAWLIDLNSQKLAVYSNPSADGYKKIELLGPDDKVRLKAFGVELEAGRFWGGRVEVDACKPFAACPLLQDASEPLHRATKKPPHRCQGLYL